MCIVYTHEWGFGSVFCTPHTGWLYATDYVGIEFSQWIVPGTMNPDEE